MEPVTLYVELEDRTAVVDVWGTYYPAQAATSPSYGSGGDTPVPATFDVDRVCVDGVPLAQSGMTVEGIERALGTSTSLERACIVKIETDE